MRTNFNLKCLSIKGHNSNNNSSKVTSLYSCVDIVPITKYTNLKSNILISIKDITYRNDFNIIFCIFLKYKRAITPKIIHPQLHPFIVG